MHLSLSPAFPQRSYREFALRAINSNAVEHQLSYTIQAGNCIFHSSFISIFSSILGRITTATCLPQLLRGRGARGSSIIYFCSKTKMPKPKPEPERRAQAQLKSKSNISFAFVLCTKKVSTYKLFSGLDRAM